MRLRLCSSLWVAAVGVGQPLPHLGLASAALAHRLLVVVVVVVHPSPPFGVGLVVVPREGLGGPCACGSRQGPRTQPGRSRCGQAAVAWLALSPGRSG